MKRILIIIVCCLVFFPKIAYSWEYYKGKIFLQHNGNIIRTYDSKNIQEAIDDAFENDTIYLSNGCFRGFFTINKSIAIIGNCASRSSELPLANDTEVMGAFKVSTNHIDKILLEGIQFTIDYEDGHGYNYCFACNYDGDRDDWFNRNIYTNINNIIIKHCVFQPVFWLCGDINNIEISNSNFNTIDDRNDYLNNNQTHIIANVTAKNSILGTCESNNPKQPWLLTNCQLRPRTNFYATIINSIIDEYGDPETYPYEPHCMFINVLYEKRYEDQYRECDKQDCMVTESVLCSRVTNADCQLSTEQLKNLGYLGTDGSIVGPYGGANPLTPLRYTPLIKNANINIQKESKVAYINISVTAN